MLFTISKPERVIQVVERGDRPYVDMTDIPLFFKRWSVEAGEYQEYEPMGVEKRYAAGMHALIQSSATEVELAFRGAAWDDTPYDDHSGFFEVQLTTGEAHDPPYGGGKRNAHGGRVVDLWCGLEVHVTIGGKFEWGLYGPLEVCVASRVDDTFTNFWVADPADDTLRAIGAVVTRHLYGQLLSAVRELGSGDFATIRYEEWASVRDGGYARVENGGGAFVWEGGSADVYAGGYAWVFAGGDAEIYAGGEAEVRKGGRVTVYRDGWVLVDGGEVLQHPGGEVTLTDAGEVIPVDD